MVSRLVEPLKAFLPMNIIDLGIETVSIEVHVTKLPSAIETTG
jgi:hypothetical protein